MRRDQSRDLFLRADDGQAIAEDVEAFVRIFLVAYKAVRDPTVPFPTVTEEARMAALTAPYPAGCWLD